MEDSILITTKKLLGLDADYTEFDTDIIMFINMALFKLYQLDIGPIGSLTITDETAVWSDLLAERVDLNGVMTYIYLNVRLVFDPPQNGFLVEAINKQLDELTWRLLIGKQFEVTPI